MKFFGTDFEWYNCNNGPISKILYRVYCVRLTCKVRVLIKFYNTYSINVVYTKSKIFKERAII